MKASYSMTKMSRLIASIVFLFFLSSHLSMASAAVIKATTIKKAVKTYIKKNMPWQQGTMRIEFPGRVSDLNLSGKNINYRIMSKRDADFIGNSSFTIRFYENDAFLDQKIVKAKLEVSMDVVVSAKSLPRNIRIDRSDVKLIKRWFNRTPSNIISSLDDVVGMKLRTSVKSNTQIKRNMVRRIPMVKRGKPVKIIFDNGLMSITTIGQS